MKLTWNYPRSEEDLRKSALESVMETVRSSLEKKRDCVLGLTGGSTPQALYRDLTETSLPWDKIRVILIDERHVPVSHPESNLGMLRKCLLDRVPIPSANVMAFDPELDWHDAAARMSAQIETALSTRDPLFDLLILGAGSDGHVASLFDGAFTLASEEFADVSLAQGYATENRMTLTIPTLKRSEKGILLLSGPSKRPVHAALAENREDPAMCAFREIATVVPMNILWFKGPNGG